MGTQLSAKICYLSTFQRNFSEAIMVAMYLILLVGISVSAASPTTSCPPCSNPVCDEATPITCFHPPAPEDQPDCYCAPMPICATDHDECPCGPQQMKQCPSQVCLDGEVLCHHPPPPTTMGKCDCMPGPVCAKDHDECPCDPQQMEQCNKSQVCPADLPALCYTPPAPTPMGKCDCPPAPVCAPNHNDCPAQPEV